LSFRHGPCGLNFKAQGPCRLSPRPVPIGTPSVKAAYMVDQEPFQRICRPVRPRFGGSPHDRKATKKSGRPGQKSRRAFQKRGVECVTI
jgi:hypothetical protein